MGDDLVVDRGEGAVEVGAEADVLDGGGAVADQGGQLAAGQRDLDGVPGAARGHDRQDSLRAGVPLEPKPPPTCSETTVICRGRMPNAVARLSRTVVEPWLESWTVRCPSSSHRAVVACGSMGWLCRAPTV